jgi:hypothetical protein
VAYSRCQIYVDKYINNINSKFVKKMKFSIGGTLTEVDLSKEEDKNTETGEK